MDGRVMSVDLMDKVDDDVEDEVHLLLILGKVQILFLDEDDTLSGHFLLFPEEAMKRQVMSGDIKEYTILQLNRNDNKNVKQFRYSLQSESHRDICLYY